jgi:signal transduction histidine kinase
MLDLARLERGAQIASPVRGDIFRAVGRCVDRLRPNLESAGMAVELESTDDLPEALFDEDALCQILDNLLDNAEKYTRGRPDRRATVVVGVRDKAVTVKVIDNGSGVPAAARRSLFQPFRRPDDDDAPAGLGLGLALARSLARAQGGDLELADSDSPGAVFVLTIPLADENP